MGCYTVHFSDYSLDHYDEFTYFNYFEFNGKKYPIGAYVSLTAEGESYMFRSRGYGFVRGNFRLVDHFIDDKGVEKWKYIIGRTYSTGIPLIHTTTRPPNELIKMSLSKECNENVCTLGELQIEFKEPNFSPSDTEVEGLIGGWFVFILVFIAAFAFKEWFVTMIIQIAAGFYFGHWRENKINEAIYQQKFKEKDN